MGRHFGSQRFHEVVEGLVDDIVFIAHEAGLGRSAPLFIEINDIADHRGHDAVHFLNALRQGYVVMSLFQMDDVVADVGAMIGNAF